MSTKKNKIQLILLAVFLLIPIIFLIFSNKKKQTLIVSQEKTIQTQAKKINHFDSINNGLILLIRKFNHQKEEVYSDDGDFLKDFSLFLNAQAFLKDSLDFHASKSKNVFSDLNVIKSKLKSKTHILSNLKSKKDSMDYLLNQFLVQNDSLVKENKKIIEILSKTKTDTITILSPSGTEIFYLGNFEHQKPNGLGVGFYKNKGYYIGNWDNTMRHGVGKHFYLNGDKYEGMFKNDKREGFGIYYYLTGDKHQGLWKNDLMNGEGAILSKEGKKKSGTWKDGKLLSE